MLALTQALVQQLDFMLLELQHRLQLRVLLRLLGTETSVGTLAEQSSAHGSTTWLV